MENLHAIVPHEIKQPMGIANQRDRVNARTLFHDTTAFRLLTNTLDHRPDAPFDWTRQRTEAPRTP